MPRTYRTKILALLLLAGGVALGALIWQTVTRTTSTTSGTIGGGDVLTEGKDAATCIAQASAFTDYPLVWAGPSVLGYPLVDCDHSMTKTRYDERGRVSHPGGDSWAFAYGTCVTPKGRENCPIPITIITDPCALTVDGRIIPKASPPVRSMTVRGARADISRDGVLTFEQSPQMIQIYPPEGGTADERAANAVLIAEALIPANALASPLSRGASLTTAFAAAPDTLCRNSFVPGAAATASISTPTPAAAPGAPPPLAPVAGLGIAVGAPTLSGGKVRVPVNSTGTGIPVYSAFNIHLRWNSAVFSFDSPNLSGGVIPSGICAAFADSDGGGARYACIAGAETTATGLLATIVLSPAASGCSSLHLFTLGAPDNGDEITGTFILRPDGEALQPAQYVDGSANVGGQVC